MIEFIIIQLIYFLVIFSSIGLIYAPINVVVEDNKYESKLNNILSDVTKFFASEQFIQIVISEDFSPSWFWGDSLNKDLFEKWSIVITKTNKQFQSELSRDCVLDTYSNTASGFSIYTSEPPDVYIIFFNSYESIIKLCNTLRFFSRSWNPGAKFLILTVIMSNIHPVPAIDRFAIDIFNDLWMRNVFRVSLIVANNSAKTVSLFSSAPYSKLYKTCKRILSFSQLQKINLSTSNATSIAKIAGYQFEPPNSFLGCSLTGHTFPFPPYSIPHTSPLNGCRVYSSGIEVQLLKLFENVYNFSIEILSSPNYGVANKWFWKYRNGTRVGIIEDVLQNKIDLGFAGGIPASSLYFCLSMTNTYIDNSMSWYVPVADLVPMWKLVLFTFTGVTWLFILSLLSLVTLLYYFMRRFERSKHQEPVDLTMMAITFGFSIKWTKKTSIRILLLTWSLFCLHVVLMFNTRLFSVLTDHPLDSQIETAEDLLDSKLGTCTYKSYKTFYTNQSEGVMKDLIRNAHVCDNLHESVRVLVKYKNLSILAKDDYMAFVIDKNVESIQRLKNKFVNYPVVMSVAKGSPFLGHLNRLVFNITESGLVFKWLSDVRQQLKNKHFSRDSDNGNYLITKEEFVWLYFVFLVGQTIALCIFLFEIHMKP